MPAVAWQQLSRHAEMTVVPAHVPEDMPQCAGTLGTIASTSGPTPDERLLRATRAMQLKDYETAMKLLSQEAAEKPNSFIVFDLRAACCLHSSKHEQALDDAMQCTKLNPDWARGWARLGAAQLCLGHLRASLSAYCKGLELDPSSAEMQLGLQLAQKAAAPPPQDRRRAMPHT